MKSSKEGAIAAQFASHELVDTVASCFYLQDDGFLFCFFFATGSFHFKKISTGIVLQKLVQFLSKLGNN